MPVAVAQSGRISFWFFFVIWKVPFCQIPQA